MANPQAVDLDDGRRVETLARAWEILVQRAREGRTISYGEMAMAMVLSPQSREFSEILSELARSEEAAGRGLLSVLVVRKREGTPRARFFALARELGRQFTNEKVFVLQESERVIAHWQGRPAEELDLLHDHIIEELEQFYRDDNDDTPIARRPAPRSKPPRPLRILANFLYVILFPFSRRSPRA